MVKQGQEKGVEKWEGSLFCFCFFVFFLRSDRPSCRYVVDFKKKKKKKKTRDENWNNKNNIKKMRKENEVGYKELNCEDPKQNTHR